MSDLNNVFGFMNPHLNSFNLEKRPKLDLGNLLGEDGNTNNILIAFSSAMKDQNFIEESRYWGNSAYHFNARRLSKENLNMDFDTMLKLVCSMTNTNLEVMLNLENDKPIEKFIDNKNEYFTTNTNCYDRGEIYYSYVNPKSGGRTLQNVIDDNGFEELLKKDKLGMTPFDHYLIADKKKPYVLGMQHLVINATKEEIDEVMNNKVFDYSFQDNLAPKFGITISLYYALLKSSLETTDKYVGNYVHYVINAIKDENSNNSLSGKQKTQHMSKIIDNVLENINDFKYLTNDNVIYKSVIDKTEKLITDRLIEFTKIYPELRARIELSVLQKEINSNSININEIRKTRRL